jgi:outer membrane protein TolC
MLSAPPDPGRHQRRQCRLVCWLLFTILTKHSLLATGCSWRHGRSNSRFEFSDSQITAPLIEGIEETFGRDGPIPLLIGRDENEWQRPVGDPLIEMDQLTLTGYVDQVVQRHPSIEAAEAAWQGAQTLYPQAVSWADPHFRFLNGPTIFGSNDGAHLWRLQAQQPISGYGKRPARGKVAQEQEAAALQDVHLAHKRLRQVATRIYFDYALVEALRPLTDAEHRLADEELRRHHVRQVSTGSLLVVGQNEQWQLDRLELDRRVSEFRWRRQDAIRRVNLLLGREANSPLPPPVPPPPLAPPSSDEDELFGTLAAGHPSLLRADALCREADAAVELARANQNPDFVLVGRFDTTADKFWLPNRASIRPQIGINANAPIWRERIIASVRQAEAKRRQRRAERHEIEQQIRREAAETVAELQRLHDNQQRMASLATLARRKVDALAMANEIEFTLSPDPQKAHRQWLKYESDRIEAEYALQQKLYELNGSFNAQP